MAQGKKATAHVIALILFLSLFAYGGRKANDVVVSAKPVHHLTHQQRADLIWWGSIGIGALVATLALASTIYVAYGEEAARSGRRPRFASLLGRLGEREVYAS
jgi:hypothetical protein